MSDTKISALTAATSVNAADLLPILQSGSNKSATASQIALSGPPFTITQTTMMSYTNNANPAMPFPQAAATGSTLFILCSFASNASAMTTPTGWTVAFTIAASDNVTTLVLYTKTGAGETTITLAGCAFYSAYFWEIAGTRTVTVHANAAVTATQLTFLCPSFTPTNGGMVFAACGATSNTTTSGAVFPMNPQWYHAANALGVPSAAVRMISCYIYQGTATGSAMKSPAWSFVSLNAANGVYGLFSVT